MTNTERAELQEGMDAYGYTDPDLFQYDLDMGNVGIPEGVEPVRCAHGVNVWFGHECGFCD